MPSLAELKTDLESKLATLERVIKPGVMADLKEKNSEAYISALEVRKKQLEDSLAEYRYEATVKAVSAVIPTADLDYLAKLTAPEGRYNEAQNGCLSNIVGASLSAVQNKMKELETLTTPQERSACKEELSALTAQHMEYLAQTDGLPNRDKLVKETTALLKEQNAMLNTPTPDELRQRISGFNGQMRAVGSSMENLSEEQLKAYEDFLHEEFKVQETMVKNAVDSMPFEFAKSRTITGSLEDKKASVDHLERVFSKGTRKIYEGQLKAIEKIRETRAAINDISTAVKPKSKESPSVAQSKAQAPSWLAMAVAKIKGLTGQQKNQVNNKAAPEPKIKRP